MTYSLASRVRVVCVHVCVYVCACAFVCLRLRVHVRVLFTDLIDAHNADAQFRELSDAYSTHTHPHSLAELPFWRLPSEVVSLW